MSNRRKSERVIARANGGGQARYGTGSRPWRVVPLAILAVIATTATTAVAMEAFRDASGDRYADEILRDKLAGTPLGKRLKKH